MTKPETEWVLVPREPTEAMKEAAYRKRPFYTGDNHAVIYKSMLAAAPSAPLTETALVKEWERVSVGDTTYGAMKSSGDRMAAALIERPNEVIIEGKRYHVADLPMTVALLESQLAAQAKRIAELDNANDILTEESDAVDEARAAAVSEVTALKAEVERLTGELEPFAAVRAESIDRREKLEAAEAALETARVALEKLEQAVCTMLAQKTDTMRNGKGIEMDDGEKGYIVHSDDIYALEMAVAKESDA